MIAQMEQVKNLQEQSKELEEIGNLLYQYYLPISNLLEKVYTVRKQGMSWDDIIDKLNVGKSQGLEEAGFFHSVDTLKPYIFVKVEDKIIPLDIRISLKQNINKYFYDKSKKAKRKIPGAKQTIERVRALVEKEREEARIQEDAPIQKFKKRHKEWFEKFRWFYSSDKYLVIGGRDASSNEIIYAKYMEKNDLFFHSDAPGAPVVVVKNKQNREINDIPLQTIREAASFGVSYSRSWKESLNSADIYHVTPDQVSKTPPAGEYLPKGSFVIRGDRDYFRNVKLEIAIGVKLVKNKLSICNEDEKETPDEDENENTRQDEDVYYPAILGGPSASLQGFVDFLVKLKPAKDGLAPGNMASKLRVLFSQNVHAPEGAKAAPVDIEEVQAWIPSGKSVIVS
nr:NFACT family protein [Candidatus Sigynarchaeota archaeon]